MITTREELILELSTKRANKKIGFTSGVFDLLHRGHIDYLEQAKNRVDILIVAINSDRSVTQNKGPLRPVFKAEDRARIVSALQSVDYVFIFDEENNNLNIELLKPDLYIKAGDYSEDKLSSKKIVESYGGKIELIKFLDGYSSSKAFAEVLAKHGWLDAGENIIYEKRPAVFLDRDGTIIENVDYIRDPSQCQPIIGALENLKIIKEKGFRLVIITNQPGIGLGYLTHNDFYAVNIALFKAASKEGVFFDKIYYCPHSKADNCKCRKPNLEFINRAVKELNIDLSKSYMVGDMTIDIQLAKNAGIKSVLVKTGKAGKDGIHDVKADFEIESLAELARVI